MTIYRDTIINIKELEKLIEVTRLNSSLLYDEIRKDSPSEERLLGLSKIVLDSLTKMGVFEFCIDMRKVVIGDHCD